MESIKEFPVETNTAVLYTLWGDKLQVLHGVVDKWQKKYTRGLLGCFREIDKDKIGHKQFFVAPIPGVLLNRSVWFREENDEEALKILAKYENDCAYEHDRLADHHRELLKMILLEAKTRRERKTTDGN